MARSMSAGLSSALAAAEVVPLLLAKFSFPSATLNVWSGIGTLLFDGDIYTGTGHLGSVSSVVESGLLKAANVTFSLNGVRSDLVSTALTEKYQNRRARLWLGVLDPITFALISSPVLLFSGIMDVMSLNDNDDGTTRIDLSVENDLAALRRVNERRYTAEDQKFEYPDDTLFDYVDALQDVDITFGGPGTSAIPGHSTPPPAADPGSGSSSGGGGRGGGTR